jgi:hypothetical protein
VALSEQRYRQSNHVLRATGETFLSKVEEFMRKSVLGAAAAALLSTTALVSAQQTQEPRDQPSAKEQGPGGGSQSGPDKGAQRAPGGAGQDAMRGQKGDARKSSEPRAAAPEKGKSMARDSGADRDADRKGRADKSDSAQDRKSSAQKQPDLKERAAEPKSGDASEGKTAEPKDKVGDRNQDTMRDRDERGKQRDQARQGKDEPRDGDRAQGRDGQRGGNRVNLTQSQRTEVRQKLGRHREARVTNVNFSINIGTRVPRDFRLHVVPVDIVAIVPAYRGYRYFVVEERVVIVHPTRYEIVEVIEVDGGPDRGGPVTASLELSPAQIRLIFDHIPSDRRRADLSVDLALGAEVPSSVELYEFPADVVAEVPSVGRYRYVVLESRIAIVDPSGRDVVHVLNR